MSQITIVNKYDPLIQLAETRLILKEMLERLLKEKRKGFKLNIVLKERFRKEKEDGTIYDEPYFSSKAITIRNEYEINQKLELAEEVTLELIAKWLSEGLQWRVDEVLHHFINIVSYIPLRGRSYIRLPKELRNSKKGLINLQNEDNKCFLWYHVRHLKPEKVHTERIKLTDREFSKKLDYSGITISVKLKDIDKIEKQHSININLFGYKNSALHPIRRSQEKYDDHMEILYITGQKLVNKRMKFGDSEIISAELEEQQHYVVIQNFNRLMFNFTNHKGTKYFCMGFLHCFSSKKLLERHEPDCFALNETQAIDMPEKGSKSYFKNHHRMVPVPLR